MSHAFVWTTLLLACQPTPPPAAPPADLREAYDVSAYRLDLSVAPKAKRLDGTVAVEARVLVPELGTLRLDLVDEMRVEEVVRLTADFGQTGPLTGTALEFRHSEDSLECELEPPATEGELVRIAVSYSGKPKARDHFNGFHWSKTKKGKPWINTSCQHEGAHSWWPCKSSYYHPEDKPERVWINLDVPLGLYGVSNGRLVTREVKEEREVFRWHHPYPLETYSVTLNVAPYQVVEQELELEGLPEPLPYVYYVLPEDAEKAELQFREVPRLIEVYSRAFGPFPFPKAKFGLVQTNFWGMEHSTAIAYGSSFPAWLAENGGRDHYAERNEYFDYILVHEVAHEWWGNAVSTETWGDFWIHEGFGTYAEAVWVEFTQGRDAADAWMRTQLARIGARSRLHRGEVDSSRGAYSSIVYDKGSWVLGTLRHYLADDELWWKTLRDFNLEFRYGNASSDDFLAVLERNTGRDWDRFFQEWVYGEGFPRLEGQVEAKGKRIRIDIENRASGATGFHVPLDLRFRVGGELKHERVWLEPEENRKELAFDARVEELEILHLERVLGRHDVELR